MPSDDLALAIRATLSYADIFEQPASFDELHRNLHGCNAGREELAAALASGLAVVRCGEWLALPGREALADLRAERERRSRALWPAAIRWARRIAGLPFVRMVAVTGGLAVDNAGDGADIDYLVVAEPGRVWTARLLTLLLVRLAGLRGAALCPNFFLGADSMSMADRSIFTARELVQMVPLAGRSVYEQMRIANPWVDELLPNASGSPRPDLLGGLPRGLHPLEPLLAGRLGDHLERWEMARKTAKLSRGKAVSEETVFDAGRVQGHFGGHRARTLAELERRLAAAADSA